MNPDPTRLAAALHRTGSPLLFAAAGPIVARAWLEDRTDGPVELLLDAMERRLGDVRRAALHQRHEPLLHDLAVSAAALGVLRPRLARMAGAAIDGFLHNLGPAGWTRQPEALGARAVLARAAGREDLAEAALSALHREGRALLPPLLCRWLRVRREDPSVSVSRALDELRDLGRQMADPALPVLVAAALALRLRHRAPRAARHPATRPVPVPA